MSQKITPCECPMAGYCERHGIEKSSHLHKLCSQHLGYFKMWEECRGPKQNPNDCKKQSNTNLSGFTPESSVETEIKESDPQLPSTMQMARNFIKSASDHIKNGMKSADEDIIKKRLEICESCDFKIRESNRCGKCGCFLGAKTKWESSHCPIGKW